MTTTAAAPQVAGSPFAGMTIIDADTHLTEPHDLDEPRPGRAR